MVGREKDKHTVVTVTGKDQAVHSRAKETTDRDRVRVMVVANTRLRRAHSIESRVPAERPTNTGRHRRT